MNAPDVKPSWPRFFLESELIKAVEGLGPGRFRCLNLGSGPSGRYRELFTHCDRRFGTLRYLRDRR